MSADFVELWAIHKCTL